MNIGLDIDGVLTDMHAFLVKYGEKFFGRSAENENCCDIETMFGCSLKEKKRFWIKYVWRYCFSEKPRENAAEVVRRIKQRGDKIYVITCRAFCTKKNLMGAFFRRVLKGWLKRHGFEYDGIRFCEDATAPEEKLEWCRKLNVDLMLEDTPENMKKIKEKAKIVCFSDVYNEMLEIEDMLRITDFSMLLTDNGGLKI